MAIFFIFFKWLMILYSSEYCVILSYTGKKKNNILEITVFARLGFRQFFNGSERLTALKIDI